MQVSVVVPCYNQDQEPFLRQRLDSIYHQTYPAMEVILLDNMSSDNNRSILIEYANRFPGVTRVVFSNQQSETPFLQWRKGIELAKCELIWIAESDGWSDLNFLEEMVKCFQYDAVMLAYSSIIGCYGNTVAFADQKKNPSFYKRLKKDYIMSAPQFLKAGFQYTNMILNVSGVVFRRPSELTSDMLRYYNNMRCTGDWVFYLAVIQGGCVTHTTKTKAYYRLHERSTSAALIKKEPFYKEEINAAFFVAEHYHTDCEYQNEFIQIVQDKYWQEVNGNSLDRENRFNSYQIEAAYKKGNPIS